MNRENLINLFIIHRHSSLRPTWMDSSQSLQWRRSYSLELRYPPLWHGLWWHSFRDGRANLSCGFAISRPIVARMSRPDPKMPTNRTRAPTLFGGHLEASCYRWRWQRERNFNQVKWIHSSTRVVLGPRSDDKPVGTVHMATAMKDDVIHQCCQFGDIGRSAVRIATVHAATDMLLDRLKN